MLWNFPFPNQTCLKGLKNPGSIFPGSPYTKLWLFSCSAACSSLRAVLAVANGARSSFSAELEHKTHPRPKATPNWFLSWQLLLGLATFLLCDTWTCSGVMGQGETWAGWSLLRRVGETQKDPGARTDTILLTESLTRCWAHSITPDKFITRMYKGISQLRIIAGHENVFNGILNLARLIFLTARLKWKWAT